MLQMILFLTLINSLVNLAAFRIECNELSVCDNQSVILVSID